jgi:RNA polymerase sigma-70 factor (ECF subfamily)
MEDLFLLWKFKRGDREALARIYEKYVNDLFVVASSLLGDIHSAHDVVHDVFESFAQSGKQVKLNGNLKSFLVTCVVNAVRYRVRAQGRMAGVLQDYAAEARTQHEDPIDDIIADEQARRIVAGMGELPYEQREAILMHIRSGMSFKEIARVQDVSINTVQSRYRYGLGKLRSLLQSKVKT